MCSLSCGYPHNLAVYLGYVNSALHVQVIPFSLILVSRANECSTCTLLLQGDLVRSQEGHPTTLLCQIKAYEEEAKKEKCQDDGQEQEAGAAEDAGGGGCCDNEQVWGVWLMR
jgi:hypothetical protein